MQVERSAVAEQLARAGEYDSHPAQVFRLIELVGIGRNRELTFLRMYAYMKNIPRAKRRIKIDDLNISFVGFQQRLERILRTGGEKLTGPAVLVDFRSTVNSHFVPSRFGR
ncbi:hypothetical protein SDC9_143287 [bioreactor metagenome]|uniref:Uncharacterized protein n=1 Tax=bioreactor metagenome TaxID=1076179 RepID=A0A645E2Y3_9ZZZZ